MDEGTQLQVFRELGQMDARIGNIEKDVGELKTDVKTLLERSAVAKGGKGALLTVGGGSATLGGLIVAAAQAFGLGGQPERAAEPVAIRPPVSQPMRAPVDDSGNSQEVR